MYAVIHGFVARFCHITEHRKRPSHSHSRTFRPAAGFGRFDPKWLQYKHLLGSDGGSPHLSLRMSLQPKFIQNENT